MNRWFAVFVAVLIGGSVWLWYSRLSVDAQMQPQQPEPAIGHLAPDFQLETLDGGQFSVADLQGTPLVINFWATWCGPCQRELPALQETARRYEDAVVIVGVDQGESASVVQSYVDELGLTFLIAMDYEFEVADRYRVIGMPTTFFVDREGVIRHLWVGEMNSITLAEGIARIWP